MAVRNIRRDVNDDLKSKEKEIPEDQVRKTQEKNPEVNR